MSSIDDRFNEFHQANPQVYDELVKMARQMRARGHQRGGIELIFAAFRWNRMMQTTLDETGYKLNNSFTSRYARLIMSREPDLVDFFHTRALRTP